MHIYNNNRLPHLFAVHALHPTDVRGDDPFIAQPSTLSLAYTDQLLGYSLRSFDNYVVVSESAHLYTKDQSKTHR